MGFTLWYALHAKCIIRLIPKALLRKIWQEAQKQLRPPWDTTPEWAKYLAMDGDGMWYWYEKFPRKGGWSWHEDRIQPAYPLSEIWGESLEKRPSQLKVTNADRG